jgi:hypothetical protein
MPSYLHEALLELFRGRPGLAPDLLRESLHLELPEYTEVRVDSAELNDIQPAEYRADLVVLLLRGQPVLGIILEVQLTRDEDKRYVWPAYVVNLRARIRCPVCLMVVAGDEAVARWARKPIDLGGGSDFRPWVLEPAAVPEITDEQCARREPELAVLSAIAHAKDDDPQKSVRIALAAEAASVGLDREKGNMYFDLILHSLSEAAREALLNMDSAKYEYQSEFAKRYFGQGRLEGRGEGRVEMVLKLLTLRFGALPDSVRTQVNAADSAELDQIAERLLTAGSPMETVGLTR